MCWSILVSCFTRKRRCLLLSDNRKSFYLSNTAPFATSNNENTCWRIYWWYFVRACVGPVKTRNVPSRSY